ncbi:MAG: LytTR family DNA-binding domain-containing protein [Suilimivivens sp.]
MKITLQQITDGKEEVIIKYRQMTDQIEGIVKYIEGQSEKLLGTKDGNQFLVSIHKVIYLESVDGVTWFYTKDESYRSELTLALWEMMYVKEGFFRCSKSMIINIYHIEQLKSLPGKRIDAAMDNGEHVIISRHYSGELRSILRREG